MARSKYRNLILIGNGFDRWQDLPTSYDRFRQYYGDHIDEAMTHLGIEKRTVTTPGGGEKTITPVEIVYGDPFAPGELAPEFFWTFETSLDQIDDQLLNLYFGKSPEGLGQLREVVEQAQRILRHLFSAWILEVNVPAGESGYRFGEDCFCINFNYTDTLLKRFGVKRENVYHIHGDAEHPASIVFGHATHPETAFKELKERHFIRPLIPGSKLPRFDGLYAIEDALYQTDKHVTDHIDLMCKAFLDAELHVEDIENIYVLGHSFGEPDVEYFDYLDKITRRRCNFDALSAAEKLDRRSLARIAGGDTEFLYGEIHRNIQYAAHHRERSIRKAPIPFPIHEAMERAFPRLERPYNSREAKKQKQSVQQRFYFEQAGRTRALLEKVAKEHGLGQIPQGCQSILGLQAYLDGGHTRRRQNAMWHISYFTKEDKRQIKKIMKQIGCGKYVLYQGIDECMADFRKPVGRSK